MLFVEAASAMDSVETFFPAKFIALPPPFQTCFFSLRKLQKERNAVAATQNSIAPAFGQYAHLQLQESYRQEDPSAQVSAQNPRLDFAEKCRHDDPFAAEALFPSSPSCSLAVERQGFAERPTLELESYFRNLEKISTPHEALQAFISGQNRPRLTAREERLVKTLKERRETVKELLMASFKTVRLRPTFSKGVIESMPEFVDLVMIKAAALKKMPEHVNAPFSYRARLYIEQAGVGKKVRWLKQHKFTYSKIGRLVYMVEDHEHNLQPKIKWLKSINVRGKDLAAALTRNPVVLEKTIHELNENVELLKAAGVRVDWIGWVIRRCSSVLACSKEELQEHIDFYGRLGIKGDKFGKMVYHFPACLSRFSLDEMHNKVHYLKAFGIDDWILGEVLASKPQLIACNIEEDWKPLVKLFYFLGIDGYGLRRILVVQPSVFCLNISNNITPKIRFLRDVGVREEAIGDVLVKFPSFLSYSLDDKIRPCVMFLLEKAAVPIDKVGKVLSMQPDLFRCSISKKLDIVVRFFIFHGFKRQQVGLMVTEFPMLLRYSLSSLKPKLSFALRVMKLPVGEVVRFPRLFSYSLESRIVPRYKTLKKKGLNYNLRRMLACSDAEFMKSLDENSTQEVEAGSEASWVVDVDASADISTVVMAQSGWQTSSDTEDVDEVSDIDTSAGMDPEDMPESSWDGAFDAEGVDEVFGEDMSDMSQHHAFDAENMHEVFYREDISDKSWRHAFNVEEMDEMVEEENVVDANWHVPSSV